MKLPRVNELVGVAALFVMLCLLSAFQVRGQQRTDVIGGASPNSVKKPRLIEQLGHEVVVDTVAFSPDNHFVLTGGADKTARLWETESGRLVQLFEGHSNSVVSVAFSPDGHFVLTGSWDKTARLWEVETGREVRRFEGHSNFIGSVAFSPDGRFVLTGSWDKTVRLWEVTSGREVRRFEGHSDLVESVAFSPDGRFVLTGSWDKTVRLWEVTSGREVRRFEGHSSYVNSVSFSPDGHFILTGGGDNTRRLPNGIIVTTYTGGGDKTVRLWEIKSGREVRRFEGHSEIVFSVAFSPDGRYMVTGSADKTARLWEVETGHEVHRFEGHSHVVSSVAFSPDGRFVLTGSGDGTARLWEMGSAREVRRFEGYSAFVGSVAFSPDGHSVLTGNWDKTARLWEMGSGHEVRRFVGLADRVRSVPFSPDGRFLLIGSYDNSVRLWEVESGSIIRRFIGHTGRVNSATFSSDGRYAVTGSDDKTARLWEVESGREMHRFEGHTQPLASVAYSPDGRYVVTGSEDGTARLWEAKSSREVRRFEGHSNSVGSVAFSPDGHYVLTGSWDKTARLWEVETGREVRRFEGHSDFVFSVAFSLDGRFVLTGSYDKSARLWEVETGHEVRRFEGHSNGVGSVAFSPDGRHALTGGMDSTTRIWDLSKGMELCRLISFKDGTWAVVDPQGRYDASNSGEVEGLHWVVGNESIDLAQLKQRYYDPGLLAKILGYNKEPLKKVSAFRDVKLHPTIETTAPAPDSNTLHIKLTNRGGGIGRVIVKVNGKEVVTDARGPRPDPAAKQVELNVSLAGAPVKPGEDNLIEVIAYNDEGWLASRSSRLVWKPAAASKPAEEPHLYAIVAGISEYANPAINLRFAAKDAGDMAQALTIGARKLFGTEKVHLKLLSTADNPFAKASIKPTTLKLFSPTKDNIRAAFAEVAKEAKPNDILVIYFAGHGITLAGVSDLYAYPTRDVQTLESRALSDPAVREQVLVTSEELAEWLTQREWTPGRKGIAALKQVMILDTCAAGAAATNLIAQREALSSDQIRAIEFLKDRTGFHVLMGSAADAVSYEATKFRQGLLTYALLQGMKGAALRDDQYVDVSSLFNYAANEVERMAKGIGGIQRPIIAAPRGQSFWIGKLEREDRTLIPLASPVPLVLRPTLLNRDEDEDNLNLTTALTKKLREATEAEQRGSSEVGMNYVDATEMAGAIRPTGTYTITGDKVEVRVRLKRDDATLKTLQIEGSRKNVAELIGKLSIAIIEAAHASQ